MNELQTAAAGEQALSMELSVESVKGQVAKIQDLMKQVMNVDEHFGIIPGTKKPALYKAGAEKLGFVFRLAAEYVITRYDLEHGHREFEVRATVRHQGTGAKIGEGVGSCSTMESKYRWRKQYTEEDCGALPREYWKHKEDRAAQQRVCIATFGPGTYRHKKDGQEWRCVRVTGDGEKIENPDVADQYNTVLKIAKKRAYVDAIITCTAASDIFTQAVDEPGEAPDDQAPPTGREEEQASPTPAAAPTPEPPADARSPAERKAAAEKPVRDFIAANRKYLNDGAVKYYEGKIAEARKPGDLKAMLEDLNKEVLLAKETAASGSNQAAWETKEIF